MKIKDRFKKFVARWHISREEHQRITQEMWDSHRRERDRMVQEERRRSDYVIKELARVTLEIWNDAKLNQRVISCRFDYRVDMLELMISNNDRHFIEYLADRVGHEAKRQLLGMHMGMAKRVIERRENPFLGDRWG